MLLFGGTLAGAPKKASGPASLPQPTRSVGASEANDSAESEEPTPDAPRRGGQSDAQPAVSPRTDALHRLTNHELRLLEELERTRSKLQAEWQHKIAGLQHSRSDGDAESAAAIASVEQLAQQLGLPSPTKAPASGGDLKAMMRSKTLARHPNQSGSSKPIVLRHKKPRSAAISDNSGTTSLPVLRASLDMLPILTSAGETPFEVGLDPASPTQQHALPIFKLPTVNVAATALAVAAKEVETVEEDRERKQASEALGLSLEEIAMLEAELTGGDPSGPRGLPTPDFLGREKKLPDISGSQRHQSRRAAPRRDQRRNRGRGASDSSHASRSGDLRKELASALSSVQHLTRLVKHDIVFAQKICPANELRTSLYFKRWGRDKVESIFRRLLFNLQGVAFQQWVQVVAREKQEEKLHAYLLYRGSKKLDRFLFDWSQRKLRQAWTKWWSDVAREKAVERLALELDATRALQRAWRGHRGRLFATLVRAQQLLVQQSAAASRIQRQFRGSVARKFLRLKRLSKRRQDAATVIQARVRGYLARRRAAAIKLERKRFLAASRIQALYRGRKTRRTVAALRRNWRVTQAARIIQRRYRSRLGRAKFLRRQIERHRSAAATKIQRIARGRIARRIMRDKRANAARQRALERAAAIRIQKVYRGHRSRLSTELKLLALREKNRWRAKAATTIQKIMRAFLAKACVRQLRQEHDAELVRLARSWVEYWSEDTSSWFYYRQETGDAIWAPPPSGYTKADGSLVLRTGQVIPDPVDGDLSDVAHRKPNPFDAAHADNANVASRDSASAPDTAAAADDDDDKVCVECEEEDARRRCQHCEDVFCDACFEKLHRSSKRETHVWKPMGALRCIECDKMKATRWCYVCQDPYCLGCFTIIHAKGNKVNHAWTDMASFRKAAKTQQQQQQQQQLASRITHDNDESAQTYNEFLQSNEYQYVTEFAVDESVPERSDYAAVATSYDTTERGGAGEWLTLVDEASGQTYYYNTRTGESTWA